MVTATVSIDLFSGRSNPVWHLASAQVVALLRRLGDLVVAGRHASFPEGMGYRGIDVVLFDSDADTETMVRICRGWVVLNGRTLLDSDRALELWLLRSCPADQQGEWCKEVVERIEAGHVG